jgi:carbon-monoxide dehydrogenase small subunit
MGDGAGAPRSESMQSAARPQKHVIAVRVNGMERDGLVEARRLLCDFLREDLGLTGTHVGCEHGICGACTVLVNGAAVRSCLLFAVQVDGAEIMTVEGLARGEQLHPLQQAFWENHGLQCGFCTPGVLMAAYEFLGDNPNPSELEVREHAAGNLCRCTGYAGIVKSILAAAAKLRSETAG